MISDKIPKQTPKSKIPRRPYKPRAKPAAPKPAVSSLLSNPRVRGDKSAPDFFAGKRRVMADSSVAGNSDNNVDEEDVIVSSSQEEGSGHPLQAEQPLSGRNDDSSTPGLSTNINEYLHLEEEEILTLLAYYRSDEGKKELEEIKKLTALEIANAELQADHKDVQAPLPRFDPVNHHADDLEVDRETVSVALILVSLKLANIKPSVSPIGKTAAKGKKTPRLKKSIIKTLINRKKGKKTLEPESTSSPSDHLVGDKPQVRFTMTDDIQRFHPHRPIRESEFPAYCYCARTDEGKTSMQSLLTFNKISDMRTQACIERPVSPIKTRLELGSIDASTLCKPAVADSNKQMVEAEACRISEDDNLDHINVNQSATTPVIAVQDSLTSMMQTEQQKGQQASAELLPISSNLVLDTVSRIF